MKIMGIYLTVVILFCLAIVLGGWITAAPIKITVPPDIRDDCYKSGGAEFHWGYVAGNQAMFCVYKR